MQYEAVIGLEVHTQLLTRSKIFCSCSTTFGAEPNSQVCPVCLGMPGVLPVLNERVVEFATRLALAMRCKINKESILARKNYFYPDLPKAYQISQFEEPFCEHGSMEIQSDGTTRTIGITRIHMEEDAGKSMHAETYVSKNESLVDINRCGVPLLEIVSDPDFRTPQEVYDYLTRLRQLVLFLGVCDGNMEEGSLRCDANVSIRPRGETGLGTKTELKNMNSFRAVEKALEFEITRQIEVVEDGGAITQQTLLWDADRNVAEPMRSKEFSHDYRYFPDPDLVPVVVTDDMVDRVAKEMPELPEVKTQRFVSEYGLPEYDAAVLTETPALAEYFDAVAEQVKDKKTASNWVMTRVLRAVKETETSIDQLKVTPAKLADLIGLLENNTINASSAKSVFDDILNSGGDPEQIVKDKGLVQISDTGELETAVDKILNANPDEVQSFLDGKEKVIGFFVGQIMRETKGKANPKTVNELLRTKLNALRT